MGEHHILHDFGTISVELFDPIIPLHFPQFHDVDDCALLDSLGYWLTLPSLRVYDVSPSLYDSFDLSLSSMEINLYEKIGTKCLMDNP